MIKRHFDRRFALTGLAGVAAVIVTTHLGANSRAPASLVEEFHASLMEVMHAAKALDFDGRYARLKPSIENSFHLPVMMQIATGSFWRKASPKQKAQLIEVFSDVSVGTYANRFSGFSGQWFQTKITRDGPRNTMLVDTILKNPSNSDVALTYVCLKIEGVWRIIDVLLDTGISELAVRRSEYSRILRSDGINGLIETLKRKALELRSPS